MSDFSLFSLFTAGLACMVPFASAYTQPVGDQPSGNPISQPGLNSLVPAGKGFTITWEPTTEGPVTLVLLKGPANDLKLESVIVEGTENDGEYVWTPSTDLEPTASANGYGIQLIVDSGANKGQYQYTTQFGISNPDYDAAAPPTYGATTSSESHKTASASASGYPSFYSAPSSAPSSVAIYPTASVNTTVQPTGYVKPTSWASSNSTIVVPTGVIPKTTLQTSASAPTNSTPTSSQPAISTGGASTMTTSIFSLVLAAGVAVFAY